MKKIVGVFCALIVCLPVVSVTAVLAGDKPRPALRFPVVYNTNPVAGRLYLQPIGVYEAHVVEGTLVDVSFGSATDYNVHFIENEGDDELTVNSNVYSLRMSHGTEISGNRFEFGGLIRSHQDMRETWGSNFVKSYHEAFPSDGFGHVPPDDQYYGAVGNNNTEVIGENREFYLTTAQLYMKYQVMSDSGPGGGTSDWSVKVSSRIPLSSNSFDRPGIAVSTGVSKEIYKQFYLLGAAGISYQDLTKDDFNADNLDVEQLTADLFGGILWDMGKPEGWYGNAGVRWSSERVSYSANSESAEPSVVTHFGFAYRKIISNGNALEFYISCNEDIPGLGYGLEPDVGFEAGVSFHIR